MDAPFVAQVQSFIGGTVERLFGLEGSTVAVRSHAQGKMRLPATPRNRDFPWGHSRPTTARATFGQKQSFTGTVLKVCFPIRKRTFELIAAAHMNLAEAASARFWADGRNLARG
jgi:hypothetical protein